MDVTSNGWMTATRPRSSAAACSATPSTCATRPSNHTPFVTSPRRPRASPGPTPASIEARCHSVAARANDSAATSARIAATALTRTRPYAPARRLAGPRRGGLAARAERAAKVGRYRPDGRMSIEPQLKARGRRGRSGQLERRRVAHRVSSTTHAQRADRQGVQRHDEVRRDQFAGAAIRLRTGEQRRQCERAEQEPRGGQSHDGCRQRAGSRRGQLDLHGGECRPRRAGCAGR